MASRSFDLADYARSGTGQQRRTARQWLGDPAPAYETSRTFLADWMQSPRQFGPLRGLNTRIHKALTNPTFKPIWTRINTMFQDAARAMSRPAELAPNIPTKFEPTDLSEAAKRLFGGSGVKPRDLKAVADLLNEGTLHGGPSPLTGKVFTREELMAPKGQPLALGSDEDARDVRLGRGLTEMQADLYEGGAQGY